MIVRRSGVTPSDLNCDGLMYNVDLHPRCASCWEFRHHRAPEQGFQRPAHILPGGSIKPHKTAIRAKHFAKIAKGVHGVHPNSCGNLGLSHPCEVPGRFLQ